MAIALLFQPLRRRAQHVANRIVHGQRATPYQVLSDFAQDMAGQLDADPALDRMASVLAAAAGATQVEVWVRVGSQLRPRVTWPPGSPPPPAVALTVGRELPPLDATRAVAVRHTDELLGAITLCKPRNEPVSAAEDKLLTHLASQAGLVLRNVRLTAELQASIGDLQESRRRLVQAQDAERQRIERNLHDGAQQQLVSLAVQLRLLEDAADDPGEVRQMTGGDRSGGAGSRRRRGGAGMRRVAAAAAIPVKFKLDENLPDSSARVLTGRDELRCSPVAVTIAWPAPLAMWVPMTRLSVRRDSGVQASSTPGRFSAG